MIVSACKMYSSVLQAHGRIVGPLDESCWGPGCAHGYIGPLDGPQLLEAALHEASDNVVRLLQQASASTSGAQAAVVASALSSVRRAAAVCLPPESPHREALASLASTPWPPSDAQTYDWVGNLGGSFAEWELLQAELLSTVDLHSMGMEGLWCFNPHCSNLSAPSDLQMETKACQGGCGVLYCSQGCQEQSWRMGHRESCGAMASAKAFVSIEPVRRVRIEGLICREGDPMLALFTLDGDMRCQGLFVLGYMYRRLW